MSNKKFRVGQSWRTSTGAVAHIEEVREHPMHPIIATIENDDNFSYCFDAAGVCTGFARCDLIEQVTRVYIAGPIGKLPMEQARIPFDAAEAEYVKRGCIVLNPCNLVPPGTPYGECMRIDLTALLTCDMIVMLPGWTLSKGATAELTVAQICGLAVVWSK